MRGCLESRLQHLKGHFAEICRWISSFLVLWIFIIKYGQTDTLSIDRIIVATSNRFGTDLYYSMYIDPIIIYSLPVMGCIYIVLKQIEKYTDLENKLAAAADCIAMVMAFWRVMSNSFYYVISSNLFWKGGVFTVLLLTGYFIVFRYLVYFVFFIFEEKPTNVCKDYSPKKIFLGVWIIYLICWLPRLVLNYPMAFDWDTGSMFDTALNGVQHSYPIVQVGILKILYQLGCTVGSVEGVFFVYMCMKYLGSTFLYAGIMFYFQQKKCSRKLWLVVLGITLFCPVFQSWSIYITKDSNYTLCFVGLMLMACLFVLDKEFVMQHKLLYGIFTIFFVCGIYFLRGNGIYVDIVFLLFGLISFVNSENVKHRFSRIKWRRMMIGATVIIVAGTAVFCTVNAYKAEHEVERGESVEGLSEEINELIEHGQKYLKFYVWRLTDFFIVESISRYSAVIQNDCPNAVAEILGEDLETVQEIEYTAGNGVISNRIPIDTDKQNELAKYILRNEPVLFIESVIAKIYGYFDIFRHFTGTYGCGIEYGTYNMYELNKYWENRDEWWRNSSLLFSAYEKYRAIPILGSTCDTGLYVWLLIIVSFYLLMSRGRKVLCMLAPCWLTYAGVLVSGYNAYMRLCIPAVLSMPILLLLCTVKNKDM